MHSFRKRPIDIKKKLPVVRNRDNVQVEDDFGKNTDGSGGGQPPGFVVRGEGAGGSKRWRLRHADDDGEGAGEGRGRGTNPAGRGQGPGSRPVGGSHRPAWAALRRGRGGCVSPPTCPPTLTLPGPAACRPVPATPAQDEDTIELKEVDKRARDIPVPVSYELERIPGLETWKREEAYYAHPGRPTCLEHEVEYSIDPAAYKHLCDLNAGPFKGAEIQEDDFEAAVDALEKEAQRTGELPAAEHIDARLRPRLGQRCPTKAFEAIYTYWAARRAQDRKPLHYRFRPPPDPEDPDPWVAFRPREPLGGRRRRTNNHKTFAMMQQLRAEFARLVELMELIQQREELKKDYVDLVVMSTKVAHQTLLSRLAKAKSAGHVARVGPALSPAAPAVPTKKAKVSKGVAAAMATGRPAQDGVVRPARKAGARVSLGGLTVPSSPAHKKILPWLQRQAGAAPRKRAGSRPPDAAQREALEAELLNHVRRARALGTLAPDSPAAALMCVRAQDVLKRDAMIRHLPADIRGLMFRRVLPPPLAARRARRELEDGDSTPPAAPSAAPSAHGWIDRPGRTPLAPGDPTRMPDPLPMPDEDDVRAAGVDTDDMVEYMAEWSVFGSYALPPVDWSDVGHGPPRQDGSVAPVQPPRWGQARGGRGYLRTGRGGRLMVQRRARGEGMPSSLELPFNARAGGGLERVVPLGRETAAELLACARVPCQSRPQPMAASPASQGEAAVLWR